MTKLLMFEVDVKNMTKGRRGGEGGGGEQLRFGVLIFQIFNLHIFSPKIVPSTEK